MAFLRRNLDVLQRRNPELAERVERCVPGSGCEALSARSGAPTVRVAGRLEASAEDPEREASDLAAHFLERCEAAGATRLVLFGLGVHTSRFLAGFDGRILVVEPSLELCRLVFESVDLSSALEKIELLCPDGVDTVERHERFGASDRGVFLSHPSARRRDPELHDELARRFRTGGESAPLRVVVVLPLVGDAHTVARGCARALRQLGHQVREIDPAPFCAGDLEIQRLTADPRLADASGGLRAALVRLIGEALLTSLQLDPPDLVFGVSGSPLDATTLERLGRIEVARALWLCQDFRVDTSWRTLARHCDAVFHMQPDEFSKSLREAGGFGVPLLAAFDPSIWQPVELSAEQAALLSCDLSLVGAACHNRVGFLPALFDLGLRIYGSGWPSDAPFGDVVRELDAPLSPELANLVFSATRVNLNLHASSWCDGVDPAGDWVSPGTLELAGAGAFQLVDQRRHLKELLRPGLEVETFASVEECRKKIRYYLDHEDERRELAKHARRRALAEHSYGHRMAEAIDALRSGTASLIASRYRATTAAAVLEEARDEPELVSALTRLNPETVLDGDAIATALAMGQGELSQAEKLLAYMREAELEVRYLNETGQTG